MWYFYEKENQNKHMTPVLFCWSFLISNLFLKTIQVADHLVVAVTSPWHMLDIKIIILLQFKQGCMSSEAHVILSLPVAADFCVPFVSGKKSPMHGIWSLHRPRLANCVVWSVSIQSYHLGCVGSYAYLLHVDLWCSDLLWPVILLLQMSYVGQTPDDKINLYLDVSSGVCPT